VVPPGEQARAIELLRGLGETPVVMGAVVAVPADRAFEERVEWPS
jgi:hypothetical protein